MLAVFSQAPIIQKFMLLRFLIILLVTGLCSSSVWAQSSKPKPQTPQGVPQGISNEGPSSEEAEAALSQAQSLEQSSSQNALAAYSGVAKKHRYTSQGATAQLRYAQILQNAGELDKAFKNYSIFLSNYPDSRRFEEAVKAQIEIANTYLDGRKMKFLGIGVSSGYEQAEKMYSTILATAPFSKYAPMAQFNLGLAYERQGKMSESTAAYQTVLDRYPNSAICPNALYQIGYVYMRIGTVQGSEDLSALIQAKNTFEDFIMQYPKNEKIPQAKENLIKMQTRETGDFYDIAHFYDRSKNFKSAFIYYNEVIRQSPSSEKAKIARARIEELRNDHGDETLRTGPEKVETGDRASARRRLQAQVESSALADYAGPPRNDVLPEELPVVRTRLRTQARDISPLPPVEPDLPTQ